MRVNPGSATASKVGSRCALLPHQLPVVRLFTLMSASVNDPMRGVYLNWVWLLQVLLVDNVYRQHHVSLQSLLNTQLPFLILRVRRNFLVEDSCRLLGSCPPRDLLRPLKVIFDGEEGVDEGGLRREFFSVGQAVVLLFPKLEICWGAAKGLHKRHDTGNLAKPYYYV